MDLLKYLIDYIEVDEEEAKIVVGEIRAGLADELTPYLGEDYRTAERTIRDGG